LRAKNTKGLPGETLEIGGRLRKRRDLVGDEVANPQDGYDEEVIINPNPERKTMRTGRFALEISPGRGGNRGGKYIEERTESDLCMRGGGRFLLS